MLVLFGCLAVAATMVLTLRRWDVWRALTVLAVAPVVLGGLLDLVGPASVLLALLIALAVALTLWRSRPAPVVLLGSVALVLAGVVSWHLLDDASSSASAAALAGPAAALALLGAAGAGRAAGAPALRLACLVAVVAPAVGVAATAGDPGAALLGWPAGALGLTALLRGRRGRASSRPQVDAVDADAMARFAAEYAGQRLAPVVVVIAAYDEAGGLPDVLAALPDRICGLDAVALVVDDGSSDGTAELARASARAYVVECRSNRGQGAALRLGYRIAREHGASYLLTTDADGQYDVADLPAVLQPVLDGRADFVTGSRLLGRQHTRDRVRRLGVHVFSWLATLLLGRRLTDTSFGLRAMRAEVTARVTLNQPQYQSSELLVGVASHGFRILEVPATMHVRSAGASKKGRNLVYGSRYARVMLGTWWREGCPAPVTARAPAMRGSADHVPA